MEIPMLEDALQPLAQLANQLRTVESEPVLLEQSLGRVLAEPITADRDSPAADVSAMDGFAVRLADAQPGRALPISGEASCGQAPPPGPRPGEAVRIFTGAVVPDDAELVIRREDVDEAAGDDTVTIVLGESAVRSGQNIRRQGENAPRGSQILPAGQLLRATQLGAAANFGAAQLSVRRPLRVAVIVTGNEVLDATAEVQPWQLRDSNGPTLAALLQRPWLRITRYRAADELAGLTALLAERLAEDDAVIFTGGVSMGDYDFVPRAAAAAGATTVFHKLAIRPGKPIYGARGPEGQLLLGLPGNPVSAAVGAVRFGLPLLLRMAGRDACLLTGATDTSPARIPLSNPDRRTLPLVWYRLVRLGTSGAGELIPLQGSGDLVAMAHSDGFVELPPGASGAGPWPFFPWSS
jgi:molybdopterin molybdotransferase